MEKPDWFNIPRESPEYQVDIRGEHAIFTYGNVVCYFFSKEWEQINHIYYVRPNTLATYIFNVKETMDELHAFGYPMHYAAWPSEDDIEAYIRAETDILDLGSL